MKVRTFIEIVVREECIRLFSAYSLKLIPIVASDLPSVPLLYCGVMGYNGRNLRGSLAVAASESLLTESHPLRSPASRDWAGELSNQLTGFVKNGLWAYGVEIGLLTPTVLRGEHLALRPPGEAPLLFSDEGRTVLLGIWLDVETAPGFSMLTQADTSRIGLSGGAAVLF